MEDKQQLDKEQTETTSPYKGKRGLAHVMAATEYSLAGLKAAFREEAAFRLVTLEALLALFLALFVASSFEQSVVLLLCGILCLIVELINSALENTLDRISLALNPLTRKAKDMGSAAQMLAQLFYFFVLIRFFLSR